MDAFHVINHYIFIFEIDFDVRYSLAFSGIQQYLTVELKRENVQMPADALVKNWKHTILEICQRQQMPQLKAPKQN